MSQDSVVGILVGYGLTAEES